MQVVKERKLQHKRRSEQGGQLENHMYENAIKEKLKKS